MAGPKSNTIEYVFEGDTLNLEQAINKVSKLLNSSAKKLRKYQEGALTAEQEAELKSARALLAKLRRISKSKKALNDKQIKDAEVAGREALKRSKKLEVKAVQVEKAALREQAAREEERTKLLSVAGQERAKQQADYLSSYADRFKGRISQEAYDDIKLAAAAYEQAKASFDGTEESANRLAEATKNLDNKYKDYNATLQMVARTQQSASKGILNFANLVKQATLRLKEALNSLTFWLRVVRQVVEWLKKGVKYAADYVESVNFLNAVTRESNERLTTFVKQQERAFGLDPTTLNQSAASFFSFGDSLGWTNSQAALLSETMVKLANDLGSLHNVDASVAAEKLRSALAGNTRAMQAWGISVHDASIEEWLASKGINASMRSMNEATQAAARYAFILEKTTSAQGDLARTLESPANQMKILATQGKLLLQNFGALIIPVLTPFVRLLNMIVQPINALLQAMTALSSSGITSSIGDQSDALEGLGEAGEDAATGLTSLDEINQASGGKKGPLSGISAEIEALMQGYDNLSERTQLFVRLFENVGRVLAPIFNLVAKAPFDMLFNVLNALTPVLTKILWPFEILLKGLSWLLNHLLNPVIALFNVLTSNIWLLVGAFAALNLMQWAVTGNFQSMMAVKIIQWLWSLTTAVWENVKAMTQAAWQALKSADAYIREGIAAWWATAATWQKAVATIAAAGIAAIAVAGIVAVATGMGGGMAASSMGKQTPAPALATGGVATGPTFALIGEGSYDEAVMPLGRSPQFRAMKSEIAAETATRVSRSPSPASSSFSGSSQGRPLILQLNGREVARALLPEISSTQNQVGVKLK